VVAENGELLRAYLAADGRWRLTTRPEDVDRRYLDTLLRYEDRRFYEHHGVDVFALARVGSQFLRHGRVVSGASTLTMQVFRLLNPGITGFRGKLLQILGAIQLERRLSKHDILATYLTLAPFGGNVEGVRAASLFYFGKEPIDLTLKESALLVAISQAPNRRRPDRNPLAAAEARDRVLNRLGDLAPTARMLRPATAARPLVGPRAFLAPHFADRVRLLAPGDETIRTTIDASLQAKLEQMVRETLQDWPGKVNAAVLVVRNADSAVRAYVGGSDFFSFENAGQLDHVRAVRSPGSTLKPAIYGLGFEGLIIHPSTIVTDRPVVFDGYAPQNFNEEYQGDMTVREALIKSINTTAVTILARITPALLLTRLRNADIPIQLDDVDTSAGLAVALGGGGMTLESLTRLYSGLANEGLVRPLRMLASSPDTGGKRVLNRESTRSVVDILADVPPPNGFGRRHAKDGGRRIAYKTGTSFGYRDAWAIGFDGIHTVGIWIGRSDAAPNPGALGVTAAAPLLYRAFDMLPVPGSDVAGRSSQSNAFANQANLPSRLYRLSSGLGRQHAPTLRIVFPSKGSVVAAEKDGDGAFFIPLIADGGRPPYFWFVDGASLPSSDAKIRWRTNGRGSVSATLMDSNGETSTVEFWIK
jgi:penicillin-binding protein 1C